MVLVVMVARAGAYVWGFPAPRCREAVGWGVYYPQCQRAAESRRSQEVRGMTEGKEKGGRVRDSRMNGERSESVSRKVLEEHPLISPWICS